MKNILASIHTNGSNMKIGQFKVRGATHEQFLNDDRSKIVSIWFEIDVNAAIDPMIAARTLFVKTKYEQANLNLNWMLICKDGKNLNVKKRNGKCWEFYINNELWVMIMKEMNKKKVDEIELHYNNNHRATVKFPLFSSLNFSDMNLRSAYIAAKKLGMMIDLTSWKGFNIGIVEFAKIKDEETILNSDAGSEDEGENGNRTVIRMEQTE
jgi:hypothetical protein